MGGEPRLQRKAQKIASQTGDGRVQGDKAGNLAGQCVILARAWAGDSGDLCLHSLSSHPSLMATCFLQGMDEEGKMNHKQPSHGQMKPSDGAHQVMARAGSNTLSIRLLGHRDSIVLRIFFRL